MQREFQTFGPTRMRFELLPDCYFGQLSVKTKLNMNYTLAFSIAGINQCEVSWRRSSGGTAAPISLILKYINKTL